jgi:hypothetical protein
MVEGESSETHAVPRQSMRRSACSRVKAAEEHQFFEARRESGDEVDEGPVCRESRAVPPKD